MLIILLPYILLFMSVFLYSYTTFWIVVGIIQCFYILAFLVWSIVFKVADKDKRLYSLILVNLIKNHKPGSSLITFYGIELVVYSFMGILSIILGFPIIAIIYLGSLGILTTFMVSMVRDNRDLFE